MAEGAMGFLSFVSDPDLQPNAMVSPKAKKQRKKGKKERRFGRSKSTGSPFAKDKTSKAGSPSRSPGRPQASSTSPRHAGSKPCLSPTWSGTPVGLEGLQGPAKGKAMGFMDMLGHPEPGAAEAASASKKERRRRTGTPSGDNAFAPLRKGTSSSDSSLGTPRRTLGRRAKSSFDVMTEAAAGAAPGTPLLHRSGRTRPPKTKAEIFWSPLVAAPSSSSDSVDVFAKEIATTLTRIEFELFCRLQSRELEALAWMGAGGSKRSPTVSALTKRFNRIGYWVATETMLAETVGCSHRRMIRFFIMVMKHLYNLRNFSCLMATMAGLNNVSVARLKSAWKRVGPLKDVRDQLEALMTPHSNYREYRSAVEACVREQRPSLPYLGIHLRDLVFKSEAKSVDESTRAKAVEELQEKVLRHQQCKYELPVLEHLEAYLRSCRHLPEERLYEISLEYCPRNRTPSPAVHALPRVRSRAPSPSPQGHDMALDDAQVVPYRSTSMSGIHSPFPDALKQTAKDLVNDMKYVGKQVKLAALAEAGQLEGLGADVLWKRHGMEGGVSLWKRKEKVGTEMCHAGMSTISLPAAQLARVLLSPKTPPRLDPTLLRMEWQRTFDERNKVTKFFYESKKGLRRSAAQFVVLETAVQFTNSAWILAMRSVDEAVAEVKGFPCCTAISVGWLLEPDPESMDRTVVTYVSHVDGTGAWPQLNRRRPLIVEQLALITSVLVPERTRGPRRPAPSAPVQAPEEPISDNDDDDGDNHDDDHHHNDTDQDESSSPTTSAPPDIYASSDSIQPHGDPKQMSGPWDTLDRVSRKAKQASRALEHTTAESTSECEEGTPVDVASGVALYDFDGDPRKGQITLRKGCAVEVFEVIAGWCKGRALGETGFFPGNHVATEASSGPAVPSFDAVLAATGDGGDESAAAQGEEGEEGEDGEDDDDAVEVDDSVVSALTDDDSAKAEDAQVMSAAVIQRRLATIRQAMRLLDLYRREGKVSAVAYRAKKKALARKVKDWFVGLPVHLRPLVAKEVASFEAARRSNSSSSLRSSSSELLGEECVTEADAAAAASGEGNGHVKQETTEEPFKPAPEATPTAAEEPSEPMVEERPQSSDLVAAEQRIESAPVDAEEAEEPSAEAPWDLNGEDPRTWTSDALCRRLTDFGVSAASVDLFREEEVDGVVLFSDDLGLSDADFRDMGLKLGPRRKVLAFVAKVKAAMKGADV